VPRASLRDIVVPGITGIIACTQPYGPDVLDRFHAACAAAARSMKCRILSGRRQVQSGNFHRVIVTPDGSETIHILLHSVLPIVAVSRTGEYPFDFVAPDRIARFFDPDFFVADEHLLALPLSSVALQESLSAGELRYIKYWRPQTVGELAFNDYD
jgi:hypothetical protein